MRRVKCYECGRTYNYDEDGFCPMCGAFSQPPGASRIDADGAVIRTDGLNKRNHGESFLHREFHAEKRERRQYGLDKSAQYIQSVAGQAMKKAVRVSGSVSRDRKNPVSIIATVIFTIVILNFLSAIFAIFL